MRAIRDQRGQTGAEYAGMLLLVALVVAAVAAGPARAVARHAVEQVRCIAAGDGTCVAAAPSGDGYPTKGPAIGDGQPIHVLPFPGAVSGPLVGAGATDPRTGLGVKAVVTASERRGREVLDARGCLVVPLSVTVDARLTGSLGGGSVTAGGSLEAFVGQSTTYLVNASPDQVEAMEDGGDAPNPVDPRTLAVGGGVVLTEDTYAGWGMTAQYRGLVLSSGHREGDRVAAGVMRLSESTVRVYVGEQEFVEQATMLGLGVPGLSFGLASTYEDVEGKLRHVDIDISAAAGWDAYQSFIADGELPAADAAGVADSADVDQQLWSSRSELSAQVGPLGGSMLLDDAAGVYSQATHADGSTSDTLTSRVNDVTLLSERRTDPGGASTTTYGLLLHDVENHSLAEYDAYHGDYDGDTSGGSTNARIDYTAADLSAIQQQVYETIAYANQDESGGIFDGATAAEVAVYYGQLGADEHEGSFDRGDIAYGLWLDDIARADSPEEVLGAIARASQGNPHQALQFLNLISGSVALARDEDPSADNGTPGELQRLDGSECR